MNREEINKIIQNSAARLAKFQKNNGSFRTFVSVSKNFSKSAENQSIFSTSLILSCLRNLPDNSALKRIKNKSAKFLLSQKSDFWSWNYWKRNSPESKIAPYPDDLDDTCCAGSALYFYNPEIISAKAIASIVNLLAFCESREGGPYYTWITPLDADKNWKDIDLAVNSNIAFFLFLQGVKLPNLDAFIERAIVSGKYDSPYYYSQYSVIYFISQWYRGKKKEKIIAYLLAKKLKNNSWGNPLETALAASALINLGYGEEKLKKSFEYLLKNQREGRWEAYPFVVESIEKKQKYYSGSGELTAAFCLEALQKYSRFGEKESLDKNKKKFNKAERKISGEVIKRFEARLSQAGEDFGKEAVNCLKALIKKENKKQIILLAYFFRKSLGKKSKNISDEIIIQLGLANLYGWLAYTVYDDFFDDEGDVRKLSIANLCLRELSLIFSNLSAETKNEKFMPFFRNIMDKLDSSNRWEIGNCRAKIENSIMEIPEHLPDYGNGEKLSDRSMGHSLGSIFILFMLGHGDNSVEVKNIGNFFRRYIIARQLGDDMHDWESDLKKGHLNYAGTEILKVWSKDKKTREINLKKETGKLQEIFWNKIAEKVCGDIADHIKKSRKALRSAKGIKNKFFLEKIIASVERMAEKTVLERKEALEFLKEYKF